MIALSLTLERKYYLKDESYSFISFKRIPSPSPAMMRGRALGLEVGDVLLCASFMLEASVFLSEKPHRVFLYDALVRMKESLLVKHNSV